MKVIANIIINWLRNSKSPDLSADEISALRNLSDSFEWKEHCDHIFNNYYIFSPTPEKADERFQLAIKPYIYEYEEEKFLELLIQSEDNPVLFNRENASIDIKILEEISDFNYGWLGLSGMIEYWWSRFEVKL